MEKSSLYWCFTDYDMRHPPVYLEDSMSYLCYQKEICPTTDKPHWQGYVELKTRKRLTAVKSLFKRMAKIPHLEIRRGNAQQAREYCSPNKKDKNTGEQDTTFVPDTFKEYGVISQPHPGRRNDLLALMNAVHDEKKDIEIYQTIPGALKNHKLLSVYRNAYDKIRCQSTIRDVHVNYIWGKPGSGKSKYVWDYINAYNLTYYRPTVTGDRKIWFDGYEGEQLLWLDDIQLSTLDREYLLNLLDIYPLRLPCKGHFVHAKFTQVFITSNHDPCDLDKAIKRRLTDITNLE